MKTRIYLRSKKKDEDYPEEYFMDFCAEADEASNILFKCDDAKCPGGMVSAIPFAMYGATYGQCPNFYSTY